MRSRPRKFARFSINTGGQSSFWKAFSELQKQHLCALWLASCAQVWRRVVVVAVAASRFWFCLGLSLPSLDGAYVGTYIEFFSVTVEIPLEGIRVMNNRQISKRYGEVTP
jgi:hypothetical protein